MNNRALIRSLTAVLTVPLVLASCSTSHVPDPAGLVNHPDGSVTFQGKTYTPEQIRTRALELDAQFKAETEAKLAALTRDASLRPQEAAFGYLVYSRPVAFNLTTGYSDDCFYLNLGVMKFDRVTGVGNTQYVSANSTRVLWWKVKGAATLNTTVAINESTDLLASCLSAQSFFGFNRVEQGRSEFRVWEPPSVRTDVAQFEPTVRPNYGVIRNGETDYMNQDYTRAVSYKKGETAVGVAPAFWSRTY